MAVDWNAYRNDAIREINSKYLPREGEGESKASQLVTAVNKLVYKWYNDGDVFDNTGKLKGWMNDLSSYANWIYRYIPRSRTILDNVFTCNDDSDYEDLLWELTQELFDSKYLDSLDSETSVDSIYECEGPYEFKEDDEDEYGEYYDVEYEDDYDDYDREYEPEVEDIETAVDIDAAEEPKNEALEEAIKNLEDDFNFVIQGLEKLERSSAEDSRMSLEIAEKLSSSMQEIIAAISERF